MNSYNFKRSESIKEKRKLLKEQTRNGNEESKRLWFVSAILKSKGVKRQEIASALQVTPQNLSYIFTVQDDCYLDTVQKILDYVGISCKVIIEMERTKEESVGKKKQKYLFRGNFSIEKEPLCPSFITACPKNARLRFLADAIMATGLPFSEFLKKVNMYYSTVQNYFHNDNIKVSALCNIARYLDAKIVWDLNEA